MRAANRTVRRRELRLLAVLAILLTALATLGPALAPGAAHAGHHLHALKAAGITTSDQSTSTVRTDQPVVSTHTAPMASTVRAAAAAADPGAARDQAAADAPTPRGPPGRV
jgi:hypothetical protein